MSEERYDNFLEVRIGELRTAADSRRRLAERLSEERWNVERAALEAIEDAHRLEREADAIEYALTLILKAERGAQVPVDVKEAANYLRRNPLATRESIIFHALTRDAAGRTVTMAWCELMRRTRLSAPDLRDGLATLAHMRFIDPVRSGRGETPSRWLILKTQNGEPSTTEEAA